MAIFNSYVKIPEGTTYCHFVSYPIGINHWVNPPFLHWLIHHLGESTVNISYFWYGPLIYIHTYTYTYTYIYIYVRMYVDVCVCDIYIYIYTQVHVPWIGALRHPQDMQRCARGKRPDDNCTAWGKPRSCASIGTCKALRSKGLCRWRIFIRNWSLTSGIYSLMEVPEYNIHDIFPII